ncbi:MAG: hypothetical protein JWN95_1518 [Frankiales bacterium]|nr:hypothetical protein [Frankiales bacterium]
MFESGSFRHGTGVSGKSDVDYFVSLKSAKPIWSSSILSAVRDALKERYPTTYIHSSSPAVVLEFGGGYERVEIIPAYFKDSVAGVSRYEIPGVVTQWVESAPGAHLKYVNDCNAIPTSGGAKSLARLAKAWKYYRDVPISSFYLEMRAANYMAKQSTLNYALDVYYFLRSLEIAGLAPMNDPTGSTGRINPCSSDANLLAAKSRLATAVGRASRAKEAYMRDDIAAAFAEWNLLFNGQFPNYY